MPDYITLFCTNPYCKEVWTTEYTFDCGKALKDPYCALCGSTGEPNYREEMARKIDRRDDK
jgi:hypothetical protein